MLLSLLEILVQFLSEDTDCWKIKDVERPPLAPLIPTEKDVSLFD